MKHELNRLQWVELVLGVVIPAVVFSPFLISFAYIGLSVVLTIFGMILIGYALFGLAGFVLLGTVVILGPLSPESGDT